MNLNRPITCENCSETLKIKYHYRGCSHIDNSGAEKQYEFHYCPKCGHVYYYGDII
jgi:uncharacterized protein with PIN domain